MKNKKKNVKKGEASGITLIALVVTIIILLILAGVSIAMLTGENSILNRAKDASERTKQANRNERVELDKMEESIEETLSGENPVEQVTDENPGQLEEESGAKVINSIEDLVFFAYDVTKGTTYEETTVKLGLSLDFNSSKSYVEPYRTDYGKYGYNGELKELLTTGEGFKPIGITTNEEGCENRTFKGIFDGNGKVIKNLYMDKEVKDDKYDFIIGLFGRNYGEIKNLGIESCNISGVLDSNKTNSIMIGGVVGSNFGKVYACYVSGNILSKAINTAKNFEGGICGSGVTMEDCYNLAAITGMGDGASNVVGGICGSAKNGLTPLKNCYNKGEVIASGGNVSYVAGIIGISATTNVTNISHCYNLGNLTLTEATGRYLHCGGIVGYVEGLDLDNCHSKCKIISDPVVIVGLLVGYGSSRDDGAKCSANDCSCLKYDSYTQIGEFDGDLSGMLLRENKEDMPDILSILGANFKMGENDYPILKWQM